MSLATLAFDPSTVEKQYTELFEGLTQHYLGKVPPDLIRTLLELDKEIIVSERLRTVWAGDRKLLLVDFSIGGYIAQLIAALRTGESGTIAHALAHLKLS